MKKLKVVTIVGTRPEIIRLSRLIPKLDEYTDHIFVHTGQNSDPKLSDIFFEDLELRDPDHYLGITNESPAQAMAQTMLGAERVLSSTNPDAVVVLGDTNSAIAAVVARRMGIPVYHLEAGNRSYDENVPEEINRRMIDHVSTFNLPYSEPARRNLLSEGIHPRYLCLTGSPLPEILAHYKFQIAASKILSNLNLEEEAYFVASAHRQENVDSSERLATLVNSLNSIIAIYEKKIIFPVHPRTRKRLGGLGLSLNPLIVLTEPMGYFDYLHLQKNALCVLSDSGTISEESSILDFPAITIRDSMERPELMETGGISMCGLESDPILRGIKFQIENRSAIPAPLEYQVMNFSQRVYQFIESTAPRVAQWQGLRGH